jgi:hypothetical protein
MKLFSFLSLFYNPEGNLGDEINAANSFHRTAGLSDVPPCDSM